MTSETRASGPRRVQSILNKELGWFGIPAKPKAAQLIEQSDLPREVRDVIRQVVKRTRLRRGEKRDVARELCAHFSDGLEAGSSAKDLIRLFGDVKAAAKLIRRGKLRNRGIIWKSWIAMRWGALGVVGVLLCAYVIFALRLAMSERVISRDYLAEFNAPALAAPVEERGWTILQEAGPISVDELLWTDANGDSRWLLDATKGSQDWDVAVRFLAEREQQLEAIRKAAAAPRMALVLQPSESSWTSQGGEFDPLVDGGMFAVSFLAIGELRRAAQLLVLDIRVAAGVGDGQRVVESMAAMRGLARGTSECQLLLCSLVAAGFDVMADMALAHVLENHSESLTNAHLQELAHSSAARNTLSRFVRAVAGEREVFRDTIQRVYTDDGDEGGLVDVRALSALVRPWQTGDQPTIRALIDAPSIDHRVTNDLEWSSPIAAMLVPNRREMLEFGEHFFDAMIARLRTPMWEWKEVGLDQEVNRILDNRIEKLRFGHFLMLFPALGHTAHLQELALQRQDGIQTAIAIELYRRDHSHPPESLSLLTPQYLPSLPLDRFTGEPLQYRLREGLPVLYSVGIDRDDDGGTPPKWIGEMGGRWQVWNWKPIGEVRAAQAANSELLPDGDWILWPPQDGPR